MSLVSTKDILSLNKNFKYLGGKAFARLLLNLTGLKQLNKIYDSVKDQKGLDGLKAISEKLGLDYEICPEDLKNIPAEGSFITVSNHPYGGADGIILARILAEIRPDYKLLVNFLLSRIENINEFFLPVNPFEDRPDAASSFAGIRTAFRHLKEGKPLGLFPAGEVSTYQPDSKGILDIEWQEPIMRMVQKANVPVIPIYFDGGNSASFHRLGKISPKLRTVSLPRELLKAKNKKIRIRIGRPIMPKEQVEFTDLKEFTAMLRLKTYALGFSFDDSMPQQKPAEKQEKIIDAVDRKLLIAEIEKVKESSFLFKVKTYSAYCALSTEMPNLMQEIGRLRELTFREVGEGTNRSVDLDEYDEYFHQLFIWDDENQQIAGAYRIGPGKEIIEKKGIDGLYINSLFKIEEPLLPILKDTLELGRSFVVKEYQRKATPLYLLWKGLLFLLLKFDYRYLLGPVSISGKFSFIAKALTLQFLKANFYNEELSKFVHKREKMELALQDDFDLQTFLKITKGDFNLLDRFIQDIDPNFTTPILVRQYINMLNTKTLGFNIDPNFNYCLDALMIMDINKAGFKTINNLSKDFEDHDKVEAVLAEIKKQEELSDKK